VRQDSHQGEHDRTSTVGAASKLAPVRHGQLMLACVMSHSCAPAYMLVVVLLL